MVFVLSIQDDFQSDVWRDYSEGEPQLLYFFCGILVAAFLGAGFAGLLLADGFGRTGFTGFVVFLACAPVAAMLGGAIAVLLLAPVLESMLTLPEFIELVLMGALVVPKNMLASETVALIWGLLMFIAQWAMHCARRREQNSANVTG
ncbi:MAG: hypothetical protein AAF252_13950 [Pseudomonadota bacterium]